MLERPGEKIKSAICNPLQRSVFKRITIDVLVDCPNFLSIKLRLKENWWKLKLKLKLLSKFVFHEIFSIPLLTTV